MNPWIYYFYSEKKMLSGSMSERNIDKRKWSLGLRTPIWSHSPTEVGEDESHKLHHLGHLVKMLMKGWSWNHKHNYTMLKECGVCPVHHQGYQPVHRQEHHWVPGQWSWNHTVRMFLDVWVLGEDSSANWTTLYSRRCQHQLETLHGTLNTHQTPARQISDTF